MSYKLHVETFRFWAVTVALSVSCQTGVLANGKTSASELIKYFNPVQKKGYLNQSQDRIIKKKAFKISDLPSTQPILNHDTGFFAIVPAEKLQNNEYLTEALSNPRVNGLSVMIPWKILEPAEGKFDFSTLDQILSICGKNHKSLILRVSTCGVDLPSDSTAQSPDSDTPKWVFDQGVKSVQYVGADGKPHLMPIFWDNNYMALWSNFIAELADKYDKNQDIHSIGITGGGFAGSTSVLPDYPTSVPYNAGGDKAGKDLAEVLKSDFGMNQRQLVTHWKYVADIFPKHFASARLNFDINPPLPKRAGEDSLDEITDYLVYRYGERIYLTRQQVKDGHHGFDDYRILLKFRNDTLTGLQLTNAIAPDQMPKIVKNALDDGISFAEIPAEVLANSERAVAAALDQFASHIGFQLVTHKANMPAQAASGAPISASFDFINVGAATAMRPQRELDKDIAGSYRIQIELRDASGKAVLQNVHTPQIPTNQWATGKAVTWQEELKMSPLAPGDYSAWMSLVDPEHKRAIEILDASGEKPTATDSVGLGTIKITPAQSGPDNSTASGGSTEIK